MMTVYEIHKCVFNVQDALLKAHEDWNDIQESIRPLVPLLKEHRRHRALLKDAGLYRANETIAGTDGQAMSQIESRLDIFCTMDAERVNKFEVRKRHYVRLLFEQWAKIVVQTSWQTSRSATVPV